MSKFCFIFFVSLISASAATIFANCTPFVSSVSAAATNTSLACPGFAPSPGFAIDHINVRVRTGISFVSPISLTTRADFSVQGIPTLQVTLSPAQPGQSSSWSDTPVIPFSTFDSFTLDVALMILTGTGLTGWNFSADITYTFHPCICTPIIGTFSNGTWTFINGPSGVWFDPPFAGGFDYVGTGGTQFTQITLPPGFGSSFNISYGPGFSTSLGTFGSGVTVDFAALTGGPLSSFRLTGIDPLVDSANPIGFPLQVFFSAPTGSFTQTAIEAVPEPGTWSLTMLSGAWLAWRYRRRVSRA